MRTEQQKKKVSARAYLNVYISRGKVTKPDGCELCSAVEKLHPYQNNIETPLVALWACKKCFNLLRREPLKPKTEILSGSVP